MTDSYEAGLKILENLRDSYAENKADRNEATTRAQLIDVLIYDVLDWDRHSVTLEDHHGGEYADYILHAPRPLLIVEAKREGAYFEVPIGPRSQVRGLKPLMRGNEALRLAISQVATYCQKRGVPYAAVSNGHQLVCFLATRLDGIPPLEGRALVFASFDEMVERSLDLWQHLSPYGLAEGRMRQTLVGDTSPNLPPKLASSIKGYPGVQQRNVLQIEFQTLSELVLEDITRHREIEPTFLEECYCPSGALSQYSLLSKNILQARYAALHDSDHDGLTTVPIADRDGVSPGLIVDSLSRRPILLIGDVGVGKTAFWRNLMFVESADLIKDSIILYIDFGSKATLATDLRTFLIEEITTQLRDEYGVDLQERNFIRGVYNLDVESFRRGLYADLRESNPDLYRQKEIEHLENLLDRADEHVRRSLEHLVKGRKEQIVLFIDNTDQRTETVQQEAFLISQELAENWPATVFVALRPETFHRSQREGTLSGYHPKAFTISPPRIDIVLEKRLAFALKLTRGEVPISTLSEHVSVNLSKLDTVLKVFLRSLGRNHQLVESIDNIASGNVRRALDLVKGFFGSGHVDTQKILDIEEAGDQYMIPLHEFERAVIFGETKYYDPSRSHVANLFDINHPDGKEHFLLPSVLTLAIGPSALGTNEGFVETEWIYDRLQGQGFTVSQIDLAMIKASRYSLVETEARSGVGSDDVPNTLRITTVGAYHLHRLIQRFTYVDAIIVDTPILSPPVRGSFETPTSIRERLDRVDVFRAYLDMEWEKSGLADVGAFSWRTVSAALEKDVQMIKARLQRSQFQ